ncbi:MAG: 2-oxo acid dehydrogenase subunit E2 [Chloroflexi bacterium]|nr:2-oxo acid dehydrogenase subunit E2 [Chloroflexota bacterium]
MPTEVIVPKVDMVMETGTFVEWLVKEGGQVSKGDPLFVIITEKAAIEVESPADGILAGATAKADDVLPVTAVIGYILAPGETLPTKAAPQPAAPSSPAKVEAKVETIVAAIPSVGSDKVRATPVARRMAEKLGVDLSQIPGRGPNGRIHKADVLAYQKPQAPVATSPGVSTPVVAPQPVSQSAIPLPDARRKQVIPIAGARKVIAERMAQSAFTAPHIHLSLRVDMTEAIRLRERVLEPLQAQTGQRVSFTAILARAVAVVLPRHPYLNASLADGNIILWDDVHLGIATSVEDSLIVPVIREAQGKSLGQIVTALADLTERGRSRRLTTAEMTGSTFTISNLGMYGIESFTAIINPPEAAILAVGSMVDTPVQLDGQIIFRPMMELTACADHRIADGATVARFLADLKAALENPYLLI